MNDAEKAADEWSMREERLTDRNRPTSNKYLLDMTAFLAGAAWQREKIAQEIEDSRFELPGREAEYSRLIAKRIREGAAGCSEPWAEEEIEVWTIQSEDYGYTADKESVIAEIDNLEDDQSLTVRKWKMPRLKYMQLPEANF